MLTNIAHRQLRRSVSAPPRRRPTAAPIPPVAPMSAKAPARSLGLTKELLMKARMVGASKAPKTPWAARAPASTAKDGARPPTRLAIENPMRPIG